ncbi:2-phospho-L-lactate guanylyltransferase [Vibrio sp. S9_S30]|uniref:2-phospho-L-lactate guanylyltransferase n=1 Tax=Vibrio sp. S9_S30 TaxID=2720226 RepID=UPI001681A5F0|nr:2-phospho-L-lactate guanylyltransferase [Vibrio sp. S9_S30]MBD1558575.1 2-phospho-L-lactate guanylyltransferase [Vibrio sp. S9_S30]
MNTCIVIPMKDPRRAKTRLSGVLNQTERENVALNLFEKNVKFIRQHFFNYRLVVVSDSLVIKNLAESYGAHVLLEARPNGLNAAIDLATSYSVRHHFHSQLVIPADIESLDYLEISLLLTHPRAPRSVIVCPSVDEGTNALLSTPPNVISFSYGPRSSQVHLKNAYDLGVKATRLHLEKLSFDVDKPEDLNWGTFRRGELTA